MKQLWNPNARHAPYADAGSMMNVPAKLVWHTTEGSSLPRYSGSAPHFTLNPRTGELWQHVAINRAAKSLEHRTGTVETNHANAIQVELIGFAAKTPGWTDAEYARIAKLARWIEANAGVPSRCSVKFVPYPSPMYPRFSPQAWLAYAGHCGHQHVPGQAHGDPGRFRIEKVLASPAQPARKRPTLVERMRYRSNIKVLRRIRRAHGDMPLSAAQRLYEKALS